ncbi:MAG: SufE family protein [Gemmatimonadota bacterium]
MPVPPRLQEIVDQFAAAPRDLRVQALLEYANRVPPLPARYAEHRELLEQVHECQTPFFVAAEDDGEGGVQLWFDCPPEAPTVRGFAGILHAGLAGETAESILSVPQDFYRTMGLSDVVSVMRLRGMGAILARLKRQLEGIRTGPSAGLDSEEERV